MHLNQEVARSPEGEYPRITIFEIVTSDVSGDLRHINVELRSVFERSDGTMMAYSDRMQVIEFVFPQVGRKKIMVYDENVLLLFREFLTQIFDTL